MVGLIAAGGLCIALVASLIRLAIGPTLYDRALAARLIVAQAALLCVAAAPAGFDVAIALLLGGCVLSVAVLKFFQTRTFQTPLAGRERTWT